MDPGKTQILGPDQEKLFVEHHTRVITERLVVFVAIGIVLIAGIVTTMLARMPSFHLVTTTYAVVAGYFALTLGVLLYGRARERLGLLRWYAMVFSFVFLYSQTLVTIFDQRIHNSIASYLLALFICAAFLYVNTVHSIVLYATAYAFFLVGVYAAQPDQTVRLGNLVNGSILTVIAFAGSILNYRLFRGSFANRLRVEQANATLEKRVNEQVGIILRSERLKHYLPSQLVDSLLSDREQPEEPTQRLKITVFFSDIRDFTPKTEFMEPEDLTSLLNEYLTEMTTIARRHSGMIDKFVGDAIMVLFGTVDTHSDREDALDAVRMAIEMQQRLRELREKWFNEGIEEPLEIRIGISTGMALVGNFGAKERLSYTAVGQCVNIAARLQGVCEPGGILVSHPTYALIKDEIPCTEGKKVALKGYERGMLVYGVKMKGNGNGSGNGEG